MREFLNVLRRFVTPYRHYVWMTVVFNILSAVLNIFSFMAIVPILQILFQTEGTATATQLMEWGDADVKTVLGNNVDYYMREMIEWIGPTTTLFVIGMFLAVMWHLVI